MRSALSGGFSASAMALSWLLSLEPTEAAALASASRSVSRIARYLRAPVVVMNQAGDVVACSAAGLVPRASGVGSVRGMVGTCRPMTIGENASSTNATWVQPARERAWMRSAAHSWIPGPMDAQIL